MPKRRMRLSKGKLEKRSKGEQKETLWKRGKRLQQGTWPQRRKRAQRETLRKRGKRARQETLWKKESGGIPTGRAQRKRACVKSQAHSGMFSDVRESDARQPLRCAGRRRISSTMRL